MAAMAVRSAETASASRAFMALARSRRRAARSARVSEVSAPDLVYPHWHQLATARDRLGPADHALLGQHLRGQ
jgi:hypothetical protein